MYVCIYVFIHNVWNNLDYRWSRNEHSLLRLLGGCLLVQLLEFSQGRDVFGGSTSADSACGNYGNGEYPG